MNKKIVLDKVLSYFMKKKDIPEDLTDKIKLWKEIVNSKDLDKVPKDILEAEDQFLRYELLNKKLTNVENLKTVGENILKNIKYSDFISLWNGDSTLIYCDSVVRYTSYKKLVNYGEKVDKINLYSGMRLKKKCRDILDGSSLSDSEILITRSYNLPCDFIIHVIEPDGRSKDYLEKVKRSYENILQCVKNNMIRHVVISIIGINKKDKEQYIDIMLDSLYEFLDKYHEIINTKIIINVDKKDMDLVRDKLMEKVVK